MLDLSHLDQRRFVDHDKHNCPFCRRNHVPYYVRNFSTYHVSDQKQCYAVFVRCGSCKHVSMHLTGHRLFDNARDEHFSNTLMGDKLDEQFFASVPSSSFVMDERIPKQLRSLMAEAQDSLNGNLLTGGSACARKIIYELAASEGAEGDDYESRVKSLKQKFPEVTAEHFDTLVTIQQATSTKVHEDAYDGWKSAHLRLILSTITIVLVEVYVVPEEKKKRRAAILALRDEVLPPKAPDAEEKDAGTA